MASYPFIKCLSPVTIQVGGSKLLVPCRSCEACQVTKQKSLSTFLSLEEQHCKYCYFLTLSYRDEDMPRFALPDSDLYTFDDEFAPLQCLTPRLLKDRYFEDYVIPYNRKFLDSVKVYNAHHHLFTEKYSHCHTRYDDDVLCLLHYPDIQRFIKRFRAYAKRKYKASVRYYAVGEYGTDSLRPHWHLLLFFDSVELARDMETSYVPSAAECIRDRSNFNYSSHPCSECVHKMWCFGLASSERTNKHAYYYVSEYVTECSSFPYCLKVSSRPHALHSLFLGQVLPETEIIANIKARNFDYLRLHYRPSTKGYQIPYTIWRSYYSRFFPTFSGLVNMSSEKVFYLFGLWEKLGLRYGTYSVSEQCKLLFNELMDCKNEQVAPKMDSLFSDIISNLETTLCRVYDSSKPFEYLPLKNILYASKRFSYMCSVLQMTPQEYFTLWKDFYKYCHMQSYANHYSQMETDSYYRSSWLIHRLYVGGDGLTSYPTNVFEFACDDEMFLRFRSSVICSHNDMIKHRSVGDRYKHLYQ